MIPKGILAKAVLRQGAPGKLARRAAKNDPLGLITGRSPLPNHQSVDVQVRRSYEPSTRLTGHNTSLGTDSLMVSLDDGHAVLQKRRNISIN